MFFNEYRAEPQLVVTGFRQLYKGGKRTLLVVEMYTNFVMNDKQKQSKFKTKIKKIITIIETKK